MYNIIYLGHLRLCLSSQEAQIVDLILNHKVLLLTLKVLGSRGQKTKQKKKSGKTSSRSVSWYQTSLLWIGPLDWMVKLTWDLHQRMKISATILKSSVESAFGSLSHLDLERIITWNREVSCWDKLSCVRSYGTWQYYNLINEKYRCIKLREYREKNWTNFTNQNIPQRSWNKN